MQTFAHGARVSMQGGKHSVQPGEGTFFPAAGLRRLLLLFLLFAGALGLRLARIQDPPLQFHATRQYISALLARAIYSEGAEGLSPMERSTALAARPSPGEPPIMEHAASMLYVLAGREDPAIPRTLAAVLWLAAALSLHRLAGRLFGPDAAVLTTAYVLFVPYGVAASRAFMPDPLMLSLFAAALLALERWRRSSRPGGFFLALVVSAAAAFVKPVCLPLLWGAFVGLASSGSGLRGTLRSARLWIFVAITLLPAALYFGYGIAVSTQMQDFAGGRFMPHLLLTPAFWKDAAGLALRVAGPSALLASLLGLLLAGRGQGRDLLAGLWIGYGVFVLLFALHTHTHDYYHLLILPPVALGAGYAGASLLAPLAGAARWMRTAASAVLAAGLLIAVDSSRGMLPSWGHEQRVAAYRQTGEAVGHSTECVFLSDAYGLPLQYHGRVAGRYWPTLYDFRWEELTGISQAGASGRLDRLRAAAPVRFFIVTDLAELQRQPELRALLESYPQLPAGESHRIYDLGGGDGEQ